MFDDQEHIVRVYGYVDGRTESFWVDVTGEGRGTVRNLLVYLPLSINDEIEYHRTDQRNILTRLVRRSPLSTVGLVISTADDDLAGQALAESARQGVSREFERRGAFTEGGLGTLLIAMEGLTEDEVQGIAEGYADREKGVVPEAFWLTHPGLGVDLAIDPTPELPEANPLPMAAVAQYLAQPIFTERYQTLVGSGDIPNGIDLREILHCSVNSATFDERLRRAWVAGQVDIVLVMGARLLGIGQYPLAQYPLSIFETFQFQAEDWPSGE